MRDGARGPHARRTSCTLSVRPRAPTKQMGLFQRTEMADRTFYLTTPIYYVNARPHLGHSYATIAADTMCRYRRLRGDRVYFLTGTDEHGERIAQVAAAAGKSPQPDADESAAAYGETWRRLGITNDDFIRTTEPRHKKIVQEVLQRLYDAGEI